MKYADGIYGIGLISVRQQQALQQNLSRLLQNQPLLMDYKAELEYTARMPEWADRTLRYYLGETVRHFATIEPLSRRYIQRAAGSKYRHPANSRLNLIQRVFTYCLRPPKICPRLPAY
jgi:hypothetical protein